MVSDTFHFSRAMRNDPEVEAWFSGADPIRVLVAPWFDRMRACGEDVRELVHDHYPTACVGDAAFAYVGAFRAHANVGFFNGAALPDPHRLLEGTGKRMRHVKLKPGRPVDEAALAALIDVAYRDMRDR